MIDVYQLSQYRENNRIEAKQATGGLPDSIWETYSAFANSLGGVILLGVAEREDKSLYAVHLLDPQWLIQDLLDGLNDPQKVSVNLLKPEHIQLHTVDGKQILSVRVPRAPRHLKPVYIDGDPLRGTYRRSGDGDFRCTPEQIARMQRAAEAAKSRG